MQNLNNDLMLIVANNKQAFISFTNSPNRHPPIEIDYVTSGSELIVRSEAKGISSIYNEVKLTIIDKSYVIDSSIITIKGERKLIQPIRAVEEATSQFNGFSQKGKYFFIKVKIETIDQRPNN